MEWPSPEPKHFSNPKVIALQDALYNRGPFHSGTSPLPDYQRVLYYTYDDLLARRIDFLNATEAELEALYSACQPAEHGRNGENVLDESYRKARSMDLTSFSTLFDLRALGISEQVSKVLLTQGHSTMEAELDKLNVYGKGDFFKAHKDTPRSQDMFGSLVVVFPTAHEGGQLVLRQKEKEWTIDFADKFATATEPSVCFVAFFSDTEHEVLPVTSGFRITLTYKLYSTPMISAALEILSPFHLELKQALVDLLNDETTLHKGGYLGFGLVHEYVHAGRQLLDLLPDQLKGADRMLADVCDELGLRYYFRLFYRDIIEYLDFISTKEITVPDEKMGQEYEDCLRDALDGLTTDQVEGILLTAGRCSLRKKDFLDKCRCRWLEGFYKTPMTQVMEITPMESSLNVKTAFIARGDIGDLDYFYGTACMLVAVRPAKLRGLIGT